MIWSVELTPFGGSLTQQSDPNTPLPILPFIFKLSRRSFPNGFLLNHEITLTTRYPPKLWKYKIGNNYDMTERTHIPRRACCYWFYCFGHLWLWEAAVYGQVPPSQEGNNLLPRPLPEKYDTKIARKYDREIF